MGNPFTTGPFNCCTCPEPPDYDPDVDDPLDTYVNLCGCPSVEVVCTSEQKAATLCGFSEYEDAAADPPIAGSLPPKKYLDRTWTRAAYTTNSYTCGCASGSPPSGGILKKTRESNFPLVSGTDSYNPVSCLLTLASESEEGNRFEQAWIFNCVAHTATLDYRDDFSFTRSQTGGGFTVEVVSTTNKQTFREGIVSGTLGCGDVTTLTSRTDTEVLSSEDTEDDALARATATAGTSCTSIYELRTTSFSFTHRTVEYTATASNLVVGVQYEGCVRIRRREAYSGTVPEDADTEWEDVEPDTIAAFTATDTEEEVSTDVELPIAQGYEYGVVGAYVWPTSAGCDCPTSYVAP